MVLFHREIIHVLALWLKNKGWNVNYEAQLEDVGRIDIFATKGNKRLALEVTNFQKLSENAFRQLEKYLSSKYIDGLVVCFPEEESDKIFSSYGQILNNMPVGIITVNQDGKVTILKNPRKFFVKEKEIELVTFSLQESMREILIKYYSQTYSVKTEGVLIKSEVKDLSGSFRLTYGGKIRPVKAFLNNIDIVLFPKDKDATYVLQNQGNTDLIGIEIKGKWENIKWDQLKNYRDSGCLTRLYLALPSSIPLQNLEEIETKCQREGIGLLLVNLETEKIKELLPPKKIEMEFDGFVYESESGYLAYKVGEPTPVNYEKSSVYFERAITYKGYQLTGYGIITGPPGKLRVAEKFEIRSDRRITEIVLHCYICNTPLTSGGVERAYKNKRVNVCQKCNNEIEKQEKSAS